MVDRRHIPSYLRDPSKPPAYLSDKAKKSWIKNAKKALLNYEYEQQFPCFHIPSDFYQVVFIHRYTLEAKLDEVISHVHSCRLFSIDTESYGRSSNLCLIQVHTIPRELPAYVLLIELKHLPHIDSSLFQKIKFMFEIIFRSEKILYGWGDLDNELSYGLNYKFYDWPINAERVDLQLHFRDWYEGVPPVCNRCKLYPNEYVGIGSAMFCKCKEHIYNDLNKPWPLQNGIIYTINAFLDKSQTNNPWHELLDPQFTSLNSRHNGNMINYAVYDCLAVTFLRLPILKWWSLAQVNSMQIADFLVDTTGPMEIEEISDDEIINEPELIQPSNEVLAPVNVIQHDTRTITRSAEARHRRNAKRNKHLRQYRFRNTIIRQIYHRFRDREVRKLLQDFLCRDEFYIKRDKKNDLVIIGVKRPSACNTYNILLPEDIFDRRHYYAQHND